MDWHSRYVLTWEVSTTLDKKFCVRALAKALGLSIPEVFYSDQGSQFTSLEFTGLLEGLGGAISMEGRGRAFDNIFVERLWRTVKYEEVYMNSYETVAEARQSLEIYFHFCNTDKLHEYLGYQPPQEVYYRKGRLKETSATKPGQAPLHHIDIRN